MRNMIVLSFITLDGVMQGPGRPTEDTSGNFTQGGWVVPYFDECVGKIMEEQMSKPFALLLVRNTFELFATYWPHADGGKNPINEATKYVASQTLTTHEWRKSVFFKGTVVDEIRALKHQGGPDLHVHGSGNLMQTLLAHDLVAVKAGLTWSINNGMVEGHVTKLKLIKRQGYGRAGFALLRKRVLHAIGKRSHALSDKASRKDDNGARDRPIAFGMMQLSNRVL